MKSIKMSYLIKNVMSVAYFASLKEMSNFAHDMAFKYFKDFKIIDVHYC